MSGTTELFLQTKSPPKNDPTLKKKSTYFCPERFKFEGGGVCLGFAYGVYRHNFSGYSTTQKAQWTCNAPGVYWPSVLPNKPDGKTWWIGDGNGGYCSNNKAEIMKKGKCTSYGHIVHEKSNGHICAKPTVDANKYDFEPGSAEALYAQILQNGMFNLHRSWQFNDDKSSWGSNRGYAWVQTDGGVEIQFPQFRGYKLPEHNNWTQFWFKKRLKLTDENIANSSRLNGKEIRWGVDIEDLIDGKWTKTNFHSATWDYKQNKKSCPWWKDKNRCASGAR